MLGSFVEIRAVQNATCLLRQTLQRTSIEPNYCAWLLHTEDCQRESSFME